MDKETKIKKKTKNTSIFVGPTLASNEFALCRVKMPRSGAYYFWSTNKIYENLNLSAYDQRASKWGFDGCDSWKKWIAQAGLGPEHHPGGQH